MILPHRGHHVGDGHPAAPSQELAELQTPPSHPFLQTTTPAGFGAPGNPPSLFMGVKQRHCDPVLFKLLVANK